MSQSPIRYSLKVLIPSDEYANHYRVIHHYTATQTYVETIERMDIKRIIELRLNYGRLPLISWLSINKGRHKEIDDYYVKTPSRPNEQARILVELAHLLSIDLIVFFDGHHITYDKLTIRRLKRSGLSETDYLFGEHLFNVI